MAENGPNLVILSEFFLSDRHAWNYELVIDVSGSFVLETLLCVFIPLKDAIPSK